eukprot:CAMPEP_0114993466 /NCGR_PEP_ID=MMETSP0216-20121206/12547_1 /TAXON_ID=223996 /ORGANISM="Protocruzia adherens, Strain Boccale" /LENGTH=118 /DNA_ID=CAMNT_0002357115 /DNA_START=30 /DNA_END=386 /DNA_ORIENTATION=+
MAHFQDDKFNEDLHDCIEYFYELNMEDPVIGEFFYDIDLIKLKKQQNEFIRAALGKRNIYSGKNMRQSHVHLKITDAHFDALMSNLKQALEDKNCFEPEFIEDFLLRVEGFRADIVNA